VQKEVLGKYWGESTSSAPLVGDHVVPERPTRKVITLREFLGICIELMKHETVLNSLYEMINHCTKVR
jgi:hypothetical protein